MRVHPFQGHDLADLLPKAGISMRGAILQRDRTVVGDEPAREVTNYIKWQGRHVGRSAGQRNDLWTSGHGEQCPDLRGDHAACAGRIPVDERINPRSVSLLWIRPHGISSAVVNSGTRRRGSPPAGAHVFEPMRRPRHDPPVFCISYDASTAFPDGTSPRLPCSHGPRGRGIVLAVASPDGSRRTFSKNPSAMPTAPGDPRV